MAAARKTPSCEERAFASPPFSDEEEEEEEEEPEIRTDAIWVEVEEAFAVATLKHESATKALTKAMKKGKKKKIKKAQKDMDKAQAKLDKAAARLEKEAAKIPALWKAEAGFARSKEMLEAAEKEVKRLKKAKKVKKNKLKKAETEVKRGKKEKLRQMKGLKEAKEKQKVHLERLEELRILAEDTSVPNETIARRTMQRVDDIEVDRAVQLVVENMLQTVVALNDPKLDPKYLEAHDRFYAPPPPPSPRQPPEDPHPGGRLR